MKLVGIVSESSLDYLAITALLKRYYKLEYIEFLKGINGSYLDLKDNRSIMKLLRLQFESTNPDMVIMCRDLDTTRIAPDYDEKLDYRKQFFNSINAVVDELGIAMLTIFELEALILADIETFNTLFGTRVTVQRQIENIPSPKEVLISATASEDKLLKYKPAKNPKIFELLNIEAIRKNSPSFQNFLTDFESKLI